MTVWYQLSGINPVPWKAPNASVIKARGRFVPKLYSPAEIKNYKDAVADAMSSLVDEPIPANVAISLKFFFHRQLDTLDRGSGKKRTAQRADVTNLQKLLEDGLQGVLFENDRQVEGIESWIIEQGPSVEPRIVIAVERQPVPPDADWMMREAPVKEYEPDEPFQDNVREVDDVI